MDTIARREIIVLDVEGVLFKTRLSTLTSVPGAYFSRILGKDWMRLLDKDGRLFLDRDATVFPIILNFLRDGNKIPLPSEEYFLQRIRHEASYYGLLELVDRIDRILPGKPILFDQKTNSSKSEVKVENAKKTTDGSSLPRPTKNQTREEKSVRFGSSPILVPLANNRRRSSDDPILPTKSDSKSLRKADSISQISLPKNFAHVAHVGWNGDGMIFEKHLLGDGEAVRKIIEAAAQNVDNTPIYNVINGASEEYGSHSIEVVLAGAHIQSPHRNSQEKSDDKKPVNEIQIQHPSPPADPSQPHSFTPNRPPKPAPKPNRSLLQSNL